MKTGKNSTKTGRIAEREFCKLLRDRGYVALHTGAGVPNKIDALVIGPNGKLTGVSVACTRAQPKPGERLSIRGRLHHEYKVLPLQAHCEALGVKMPHIIAVRFYKKHTPPDNPDKRWRIYPITYPRDVYYYSNGLKIGDVFPPVNGGVECA
jgi:hypothetical protein